MALAESSLVSARALVGFEWVAKRIGGVAALDEARVTIRFDAEGRVSGSSGCNDFQGIYVIVRERLRFGSLAETGMACPGRIGEQERRLHAELAAARLVRLVDGALVMRASVESPETRFVRRSVARDR